MRHLWLVLWGEIKSDFKRPMDSIDWLVVLMTPLLLSIPITIMLVNT